MADQSDVSAIRISVARGSASDLEKALEIAGAAARDLARQAARRQKSPGAKSATRRRRAEAALIQI